VGSEMCIRDSDEDIRYLQKEATALKDSDNISIVPSIAGGAV